MKNLKFGLILILSIAVISQGCASLNKTTKGGAIGAAAGGAAGAVVGRASGNTAMGAVIGAAVGGATGAVIGNKMDKQAKEIENEVAGVKVERVGEGIVLEFENDVLFGFDRADLTTDAKSNLDKLVQVLNKYPDTNIEVHGHTDDVGSDKYNQKLSVRRSKSVADYLESNKIDSKRLTPKGFGEEKPVALNDSDENRAKNRRVEFAITANEKMIRESQE